MIVDLHKDTSMVLAPYPCIALGLSVPSKTVAHIPSVGNDLFPKGEEEKAGLVRELFLWHSIMTKMSSQLPPVFGFSLYRDRDKR